MPKSPLLSNAYLLLLLNNIDIAGIGDIPGLRGSTIEGFLYVSAHTADPDGSDDQTEHESAYGDYDRIAVARNGTKWVIVANQAANLVAFTFPTASSPDDPITHIGLGTAPSGAGQLLYSGPAAPNQTVGVGTTPQVNIGAFVITET